MVCGSHQWREMKFTLLVPFQIKCIRNDPNMPEVLTDSLFPSDAGEVMQITVFMSCYTRPKTLHKTQGKLGRKHPSISLAQEPTQRSWKPQTAFLSYGMRKCHTEFEKLKNILTWTSVPRYLCLNRLFKVTADSCFHFPWNHFQTGERVSNSLC